MGDRLVEDVPCDGGRGLGALAPGGVPLHGFPWQGLARQHVLVNRSDLVRERLDDRRVDGKHRVEEVCESYAVRLGDEAELIAVGVEGPRKPLGIRPMMVQAIRPEASPTLKF